MTDSELIDKVEAMLRLERTSPPSLTHGLAIVRTKWLSDHVPENRHSDIVLAAAKRIHESDLTT